MSPGRWLLERPRPSFAQLCVLTHHVFDGLGHREPTASDAADELKWALARAGFSYPAADRLAAAVEAVTVVRRKGYRTPRRRPSTTKGGA